MKNLFLATTLVLIAPITSIAAEVDQNDITVFQPGSPALASDVNSTIQALITAINDNAARLQTLENPVTMDDLVGRSFCAAELLNRATHDQNTFGDMARSSIAVIRSVLTINSPTQMTFTSNSDEQIELLMRDKQADFGEPGINEYRQVFDSEIGYFSFPAESETLTISGFTAGVLTTTDGLIFQISRDGNVMTNAGIESVTNGTFSGHESFMLTAIRCD